MSVNQPYPAVIQVRLVSPVTRRRIAASTAARSTSQVTRFVGLAADERDRIDVLVDAHQREAQVRLARVAVGVARRPVRVPTQ